MLVGNLLELAVIVPLCVSADRTPYLFQTQNWAIGLFYLKVMWRLVTHFELATTWKQGALAALADGVTGIRFQFVAQRVLGPVLVLVLALLSVPYFITHVVLMFVVGTDPFWCEWLHRYSYFFVLGACVFATSVKHFRHSFAHLHNSIRDDKYLVARRLHNHTGAQLQVHQPMLALADHEHTD